MDALSQVPGRYDAIEVAEYQRGDTIVRYRRRRFLPSADALPSLAEVPLVEGDRLDLIAARTLGNAHLWWRIADANEAMNPRGLTSPLGRILRIPVPTFEEPR